MFFVALTGLLNLSQAQDNSQFTSPSARAACKFADAKTIAVNYSSPRMHGRKIYGGLVPYGEIWRVGANEATAFVTNANLTVGGKDVPAGSYTLFSVPGPSNWMLVISKKKGEWGIPYPGSGGDLTRIGMKVETLPSAIENFTIGFDQTGMACTMRFDWEKTRASIQIVEKK